MMIILAIGIMAHSQTPPEKVNNAFNKKFANAGEVKWEQEEADEWEVEFNLDGQDMSASFDASGTWMETEGEVKKEDIPAEVFKAICLDFDGWEFEKTELVETPDFKGYEIVLEKEDTEVEILVSSSGVITIKEVDVEDDDD